MKFVLLFALAAVAGPVHFKDVRSTKISTERCGYNSCTDHDPALLNIHIVAHTHDDVGWLKTVDQYYFGTRNEIQNANVEKILDSVVKELWNDPKRKFVYVELAFFWKWWMRQKDEVKLMVYTLVKEGRLQFAGGAWSMNDEAASHYQSIIDQFTWGLRKLNLLFGECGRPLVGWQIDPFGHSREFASLLAAMGYDGLFLGRIDYQDMNNRLNNKQLEMLWRGDDDLGKSSDIFTGTLYGSSYYPPQGFCFDMMCSYQPVTEDDNLVSSLITLAHRQAEHYNTRNVLLTMGGDFHYQNANSWYSNLDALIRRTNLKSAKEGLGVKAFYSTPTCYLKAVKDAKPTLPTKQDDFFPYATGPNTYWTGYFTSRPTTKFFERLANSYLQMLKQLQVLARLPSTNRFVLNDLKEALGVMQHHDAITGTEKQHVAHDYERILHSAIEDALLIAQQTYNKYMQADATKPPILHFKRCALNESSCHVTETSKQFVVTVYNSLAWSVDEAIRIPVRSKQFEVYAPNGKKITHQIVDIPKAVQTIPTRYSSASYEIVFIARLKPVSFKSYYIRSKNRAKRSIIKNNNLNRFNFYKEDVEYIDVASNKGFYPKAANFRPYFDNINTPCDDSKIVNAANDAKNSHFVNMVDAKMLGTVRHDLPFEGVNDELLMLSDDPDVERHVIHDTLLENQHMRYYRHFNLAINKKSTKITVDGTDVEFATQFYYYKGHDGSGAYIFRPQNQNPIILNSTVYSIIKGPIVQEIRFAYTNNVFNILRLYNHAKYIENDWVVGPIDVSDNVGKEFVVRYETNIKNFDEFYTDSNGRQMIKRKLNKRPTWNLTMYEPVASNYYPITNRIYIKDDDVRLSILTDRAEGGTSHKGDVELMLHRRLLYDDGFGVDEALNEVLNGLGLVARGRHRVLISKISDEKSAIEERKQIYQFHLQPIVLVADAEKLSLENWMLLTKAYSFVNALPEGVHLLTVEPWLLGNSMLIRLENYLEISDKYDTVVSVDLRNIFKAISVISYRETMLAANQWRDGYKKLVWNKTNDFADYFNEQYGKEAFLLADNDDEIINDDKFVVKIRAKQIRTFVVDYRFKNISDFVVKRKGAVSSHT